VCYTDVPVCHLLSVPAEGVVLRSGLAAAQRLPETAVEGAEALQVGYELPEVKRKEREREREGEENRGVIREGISRVNPYRGQIEHRLSS